MIATIIIVYCIIIIVNLSTVLYQWRLHSCVIKNGVIGYATIDNISKYLWDQYYIIPRYRLDVKFYYDHKFYRSEVLSFVLRRPGYKEDTIKIVFCPDTLRVVLFDEEYNKKYRRHMIYTGCFYGTLFIIIFGVYLIIH